MKGKFCYCGYKNPEDGGTVTGIIMGIKDNYL